MANEQGENQDGNQVCKHLNCSLWVFRQ